MMTRSSVRNKKDQKHCLICHCVLPVSKITNKEDVAFVLDDQDHVSFFLTSLLEVPKKLLVDYRSEFELWGGDESWLRLCDDCWTGVEQARVIYQELLETVKRFRRKQREIVERIRECGDGDRQLLSRKGDCRGDDDKQGDKAVRKITDKTRDFVRDHDYKNFEGPMLIEGLSSGSFCSKQCEIPLCSRVKEEIDDECAELDLDSLEDIELVALEQSPNEQLLKLQPSDLKVEVKDEHEDDGGNVDCSSPASHHEGSSADDEEGSDSECSEMEEGEDKRSTTFSDEHTEESKAPENTEPSKKKSKCRPTKEKKSSKRIKIDCNSGDCSCFFCNKQFATQNEAGSHMGVHHKAELRQRFNYQNGKYHCTDKGCAKSYVQWRDCKDHIGVHLGKPSYSCPTCSEKFYMEHQLQRHVIKGHEKREKSFCEVCGKSWKSQKSFQKHMAKHKLETEEKKEAQTQEASNSELETTTGDEALRCHVCGKQCKTPNGFKHHLLSIHQIRLGRMKYPCTEEGCGRVFIHKETMETHVAKLHRKEPLFYCDTCGQGFYRKQILLRHQQLKHSSEKFVCEACGESFPCADYLYCHRSKYHTRQELSTTTDSITVNLKKSSSDQPPVICELCGESFSNPLSIKQHIRYVHEKKFSLHCDHCGEGVRGPSHLRTHLFFRHQIGDKPETNVRNGDLHQCHVTGCKRRFYGEKGKILLERHTAKEHGDGEEKKYKCGFCGNGFCDKYKFQQHEMTHTNKESRPFKCDICDKGFTNRTNLRYHEVFTHKVEKKFVRRKLQRKKKETQAS